MSLRQYQVYYLNRQKSQGGGVALGVYNEIESTLINEGDDDTEVLSVKVFLEKTPVRAILAYAPQENALLEKKEKFWDFLDKEVNNAEIEGDGLIIQMDAIYMLEQSWLKMIQMIRIEMDVCFVNFLPEIPS